MVKHTNGHDYTSNGATSLIVTNPGWRGPFTLGVWLIAIILVVCLRGLELGDDARYLRDGRQLLTGVVPPPGAFPLSAAAVAVAERLAESVCQLPACVPSLWAGRLLVAVSLVVSGVATSALLRVAAQPAAARLVLLLFPFFPSAILLLGAANASDWTALALTTTTAFLTLRACQRPSVRSAIVVAAAVVATWLSRPEGLPLAIVCGMILVVCLPPRDRVRSCTAYVAALGFFLTMVALGYGALGQTVDWTNREKSYLAFEQGYGHVFPDRITGSPWFEGRDYAALVFGTPEENHHSIATAAWRHPAPFVERMLMAAIQGARVLAIVSSVSVPLVLWILVGVLWAHVRPLKVVAALPSATRRALLVALGFPLIILPYTLTFFRMGYFLIVIWIPIALLATCVVYVTRRLALTSTLQKRLFVAVSIVSMVAGGGVGALKVVKWRNRPLTLQERLVILRGLAAARVELSTVWTAETHLVRYAKAVPFGVAMPPPRSCAELETQARHARPRYLLFEVKDYASVPSKLQQPDLSKIPALAMQCRLASPRELTLPAEIAPTWRLFDLRWAETATSE